jgi:hypothetical protein
MYSKRSDFECRMLGLGREGRYACNHQQQIPSENRHAMYQDRSRTALCSATSRFTGNGMTRSPNAITAEHSARAALP